MLKHYGISSNTYYKRIRMGYTLKEVFLGKNTSKIQDYKEKE